MIRVGVDVGGTFTDIILESQGATTNGLPLQRFLAPHMISQKVL